MIKVLPYIKTLGSERFKKFLLSKFELHMLNQVEKDSINHEPVFDGWYGKSMGNWYKFRNDEGDITLEFFLEHYEIIKRGKMGQSNHRLPFPNTINDFINDMCRLNIDLYWSTWIDDKFEPKDYLDAKGVEEYYRALLDKMEKSHELSQNL